MIDILRRKQVIFVVVALLLSANAVQAATVGDGNVTTWKNDFTAATTITIDDNNRPDHAWWLATGDDYDVKFTWFVITGLVGGNSSGFHGNWQDFIDLKAAGHDIQSHSVDHLASGSTLTIQQNYSQSITDLETNMPGNVVRTLAYPNGLNPNNANDKTVAGQHYIGARGVVGTPNKLNSVDYLNVNSISSTNNGFQYPGSNVNAPWADASQMLTQGNQYYEGWLSYHAHSVNATQRANITGLLDYLTTQPNGFWIAPFTDVSQYAQERDVAQLSTQVISSEEIQYTLTDTLDDAMFDQPLTVKVRVDNSWTEVIATQGSETLPVTLIQDGGEQFALVDSVPDLGVVTLTVPVSTGDFDQDTDIDGEDFLRWQRGFGTGMALAEGDANNDGTVNAADLLVWSEQYGNLALQAAVGVPEPSTAILSGIFLGMTLLARESTHSRD